MTAPQNAIMYIAGNVVNGSLPGFYIKDIPEEIQYAQIMRHFGYLAIMFAGKLILNVAANSYENLFNAKITRVFFS